MDVYNLTDVTICRSQCVGQDELLLQPFTNSWMHCRHSVWRMAVQFKMEINNVLGAIFVLLTSRQRSLFTLWQSCLHLFLTINQYGEGCGCQRCSSVRCCPLVIQLRGSLQAWQQPWMSIRFAEKSIENTCALEQERFFFSILAQKRKEIHKLKLDSDFISLMTNIFKSTELCDQDVSFSAGYRGRMQRENAIQVPQFPQIIIFIRLKKNVSWIKRKSRQGFLSSRDRAVSLLWCNFSSSFQWLCSVGLFVLCKC